MVVMYTMHTGKHCLGYAICGGDKSEICSGPGSGGPTRAKARTLPRRRSIFCRSKNLTMWYLRLYLISLSAARRISHKVRMRDKECRNGGQARRPTHSRRENDVEQLCRSAPLSMSSLPFCLFAICLCFSSARDFSAFSRPSAASQITLEVPAAKRIEDNLVPGLVSAIIFPGLVFGP